MPKGCKLNKPSQDGVYRFPRGFNLTGPPCDEGVLVIGDLRLPVALRAGPPTTLLVRSVKLGAPEYTRRISAMKPAGFEVRGEGGHRDEMIGIDSCLPACLNVGMHSSAGEVLNGWPRVVATHSVLLLCVMPCRRLIVCCCCLQPIKWSFLNIFARTNPSYGYGVAISQMQNFPPLLKYNRSQTDLDFRLVDSWGNPASIAARGMDIKVDLGPLHLSALLAKASGGTMPAFSLVVKRQGKGSAAAAAAAQSREAVKLAVSAAGLKQQVPAARVVRADDDSVIERSCDQNLGWGQSRTISMCGKNLEATYIHTN